jgi:DNA-binding GntR family transcriptional regulator
MEAARTMRDSDGDGDGLREPLAEKAYRLLRSQIIRCELTPGSRFTESDAALQLGLGKTPIREALTRLSQENLVRNLPRIGYQVVPITMRAVRDTFAVRAIVEPAAIRLAAPRVAVPALRELAARCLEYDPRNRESTERFIAANRAFHMAIIGAAGNALLTEIMDDVLDRSERFMRVAMLLSPEWTGMMHTHDGLIAPLERGDGSAAARVSEEGILTFADRLHEVLMSAPSVLAAEVDVLVAQG